jgi:hypothetical protein
MTVDSAILTNGPSLYQNAEIADDFGAFEK